MYWLSVIRLSCAACSPIFWTKVQVQCTNRNDTNLNGTFFIKTFILLRSLDSFFLAVVSDFHNFTPCIFIYIDLTKEHSKVI